jgi:pseudomonalisin
MFRRAIVASALVLAVSLSACGGGGHATPVPVAQPASGQPAAVASNAALAFGASLLKGATAQKPAQLPTVHFQALVRMQNAAGLESYARSVSDPHSGLYRQFLAASDIGARYGATAADYQAAAAYFRSYNLSVGGWPQRLALSVSGKQADVERAFGTSFGVYSTAKGSVIGPLSTPHLPATVPVVAVSLVQPLGANAKYRAMVPVPASQGQGNNFTGGYTPQQIAAAFDYTGAYAAGFTGAGIKLGIIGTGPVDPADLALYKQIFSWTGSGQFVQVPVTSSAAALAQPIGAGSPTSTIPPVTGPCNGTLPTCNPEDGEAQIDTEQALLAKDANTYFYLAYVPDECGSPTVSTCAPDPTTGYGYAYLGITETDDEVEQAIADNTGSNNGPDILSLSYGQAEQSATGYFEDGNGQYSTQSFGVSEYAALAAEGVAVFVSSGDAGAQGCARPLVPNEANDQCVSWPASSPDVVSVGGVTTPLDNAGRFLGPLTGWGEQTGKGAGGSGGGVSAYVPAPSWQTGSGILGTMRNQPDASLEADDWTGVATIANANFGYALSGAWGGTSVAAPEMAAMWALVLQACKQTTSCHGPNGTYRLGNPAPLFYGIYNNTAAYGTTFYDVTFGNNGVVPCLTNPSQVGACPSPVPSPDPGFNAGKGYDQVTGIGVPFARHLIKQVVGV